MHVNDNDNKVTHSALSHRRLYVRVRSSLPAKPSGSAPSELVHPAAPTEVSGLHHLSSSLLSSSSQAQPAQLSLLAPKCANRTSQNCCIRTLHSTNTPAVQCLVANGYKLTYTSLMMFTELNNIRGLVYRMYTVARKTGEFGVRGETLGPPNPGRVSSALEMKL